MAKSNRFRIIILVLLALIILAGAAAYTTYQWVQQDNIRSNESVELFIPTGSSFSDLMGILDQNDILKNASSFERVAGWMKFGENIKAGRYIISPEWSNRTFINHLRTGRQTAVKVVLNNARTLKDVAGKLSSNLEMDSASLLTHLENDQTQNIVNHTPETMLSLFIPNTYELFWNISPTALVKRMEMENAKFWNARSRAQKAEELGLTHNEVYTLASIVEKETQSPSERPTVAGLYLNRLRIGMALQADPTVVFAVGDFGLRRVLNKHLAYESPYNTYLNAGLPPGPIYMPSISSIDAVLNAESHNYIYMCAKPDNSGKHAFAANSTDHNINANRYRRWLDQRGIR